MEESKNGGRHKNSRENKVSVFDEPFIEYSRKKDNDKKKDKKKIKRNNTQ